MIIIDLVLVLVLGLEGLVLVLVFGCLFLVLVLVLVGLVLVLVLGLEGQVLVNITARKGHGVQLPPSCHLAPQQIHLIFLTSFTTNVPPCRMLQLGYKTKYFLLASLAALFCTSIFIVVQALSVIAMVS